MVVEIEQVVEEDVGVRNACCGLIGQADADLASGNRGCRDGGSSGEAEADVRFGHGAIGHGQVVRDDPGFEDLAVRNRDAACLSESDRRSDQEAVRDGDLVGIVVVGEGAVGDVA